MKLIDEVKKLNKDELIYIGAKSAFFFIGTPEEFLKYHEELSAAWYKKLQQFKRNAENNIKNHEKVKPEEGKSVTQRVQNIRTRKIEDVVIPYDTLIKQWNKKRDSLIKSYNSTSRTLEKFTPFDKRTVKEKYPRIDNPLSTVLIVTGNEAGTYWTLKEYKSKIVVEEDDDE